MKASRSLCKHLFIVLSCILVFGSVDVIAGDVIPDFAPGQEWSIKSSPPTQAKVVVNRIERWRGTIAVHVSIIDIPQSSLNSGPNMIRIDHIPFELSALAKSVDKLLATGVAPPPNFEAGYQIWKQDNGGIYTITVTEATHIGHEPTGARP